MHLKKFIPAALALPALCFAAPLVLMLRYDAPHAPAASAQGAPAYDFLNDDSSALRCNSRNMTGVGLKGDYFERTTMEGEPLLSRVDTTVEFDASLDWPAEQLASRPRAARWHGWVKAPLSGRFRFHGQPGATVTVSGIPMAGRGVAPDVFLDMAAGTFYPIVMEADLAGATQVRLEWTAPHGVRYVIPRALLFLPTP